MFKITSLLAGALALGACAASRAAEKDVAGYGPERAELAAQMPVYVVALNARVRQQMDYPRNDARYMPQTVYSHSMPGLSIGQAVLVDAVGNALAAALIEGSIYGEAKERAAAAYAPLRRRGCDLPLAEPLAAVQAALARAPWGTKAQPIAIDGEQDDWEKRIPKDRPRQVFSVTSSLAPGAATLVTTLDIAGYAPQGEGKDSSWQKQPLWRDQLIVVSEWMELAPKTEADIADLVAEEDARFAESGDLERVAKVAKDRYGAGRDGRARAVAADRLHQRNLKFAREATWSPVTEGQRRAALWSRDECAPMRAALALSGAELGRMLDDLYAQRLPPRLSVKDDDSGFERPGQRGIYALPGGTYVSRNDGGSTQLVYRYSLLPKD